MTPNFPRLPYIPTHCTSGPSLVSILRSACSSCGLRSASSCVLSFDSAASLSSLPSGISARALAPRSSCDNADTASTRLGGDVDSSMGMELIVSSHDDAAESMDRADRRCVLRLRRDWRVARGSSASPLSSAPSPSSPLAAPTPAPTSGPGASSAVVVAVAFAEEEEDERR